MKYIKNFSQIAKTKERKILLKILEVGIKSVSPKNIFPKKIKIEDKNLIILNKKFDLKKFRKIYFIGIGKMANSSYFVLKRIFKKFDFACILDPSIKKSNLKNKNLKIYKVSHPFVKEINLKATKTVLKLAQKVKEDDLIIFLISGGGSASLSFPLIDLNSYNKIFEVLTKKGAQIKEINTLRKHLDLVKGGGLAKIFFPGTIISLIISDVIGNDLSFIASGPTIYDKTSILDAKNLLKKYGLEKKFKKIKFLETPKEKKYFKKVHNFLILSNKDALLAMKKEAKDFGLKVKIFSDKIQGNVKEVAKKILSLKEKGLLIGGGETTVEIKGKGKGGRNQELCLWILKDLKENQTFLSFASDGLDFYKAAGAIVDFKTKKKAKKLKLSVDKYLKNNDSFHFFLKTGDLIFSEKTGINIADLYLFLKSPISFKRSKSHFHKHINHF